MTKKAFLLILDGWGLGQKPEADAIFQANTPFFDNLWSTRPHSTLITYGEDVDEAISMAKEAIELYIEELQERGVAIPDDSNTLEYSLTLETK